MKSFLSVLHSFVSLNRDFDETLNTTVDSRPSRSASFFYEKGRDMESERGSSLVEFALTLPLMLALVTGMFTIGIATNNYMILTNAVGAGARALSLTRGQTTPTLAATDPCAYAVQIANQAGPGLNTAAITYTITWTPSGGSTTTYSKGSCAGASFGANDSIQVTGVYPITLTLFGWSPKSTNVTAQTAELVQ
jgi:Flp pilus assembly protein TadG